MTVTSKASHPVPMTRYVLSKLGALVSLVCLFYLGLYMDPVMFWIQDLRASLLGQ